MGVIPGEPRESPKPQPLGNITMIILFTSCTICGLFLIWRRLSSLRGMVPLQLKALTTSEGRIRLSEDDGPPANEFIAGDSDDEGQLDVPHGEPLSQHIQAASRAWREPNILADNTALRPGGAA